VKELERTIGALATKRSAYVNEWKGIENEARKCFFDGDDTEISCQTFPELEFVEDLLQQKKAYYEEKKHIACVAKNILGQIREEEMQEINGLLNDAEFLSMFVAITGNRYVAIGYVPEATDEMPEGIFVETPDGVQIPACDLSSGAFDQLYFTIRFVLGKKLLKDHVGFFLLDDPFIKADEGRLARMLDMLVDWARAGWQVIYFTAKKEVWTYFEQVGNDSLVKLINVHDFQYFE
jgi:uncharacterized protein YhaN